MVEPKKWQGHLVCQALVKLTAQEWVWRINALPQAQQAGVASIVFWDYADRSKEPATYRRLFSDWLDTGINQQLPLEQLEAGLLAVGYPSRVITRRLPVSGWVRKKPGSRPRIGTRRWG